MPTTPARLTRAQLDALAQLHHRGELSPLTSDIYRPSARTRAALVTAGVASVDAQDTVRVVPAVNAYVPGRDTWHVEVPDTVHPDDRAKVARAVIAGEVWARESQAYIDDWRPRVQRVGAPGIPTERADGSVFWPYREA